ncbi:MAG: sulfatase-like hydrolase/transferase, partial [Cyclobacteriaceae bacterium]|nr:sulfatase-like hydrolase/transferase [Cyclobacteriaceae bacterium]
MRRFVLLLIVLSLSLCSINGQSTKRPNILFAFADDMGKYASCYADQKDSGIWQEIISTPNIDKIAQEGVLFNNAFVNAPSCTPCRSSILSGQYFYKTNRGAILQGAVWDESIPTYPLLLEKDGYHIGFTYKVWSPGTPRDAGYGGERNKY